MLTQDLSNHSDENVDEENRSRQNRSRIFIRRDSLLRSQKKIICVHMQRI